jgi:hypothetical protein
MSKSKRTILTGRLSQNIPAEFNECLIRRAAPPAPVFDNAPGVKFI